MGTKICNTCFLEKEISEFYLNRGRPSSRCKECVSKIAKQKYELSPEHRRRQSSAYREKNLEKIRSSQRHYYRKNKELMVAKAKLWSDSNKDKRKEIVKRYISRNPGRKTARQARYRHQKNTAMPKWLSAEHIAEINSIYETCPKGFHVDHIVPINGKEVCGLHVPWNLRQIPKLANLRKGNRLESDTVCYQKKRRDATTAEDKALGMPFGCQVSDFIMAAEKLNAEHRNFIKRYEWLGTIGFGVRWVFTARYKGYLGGVVMISEPNAYTFGLKGIEALIQRGACASWTPKNLGSSLVMFACRWMVSNTEKRAFVAYSDPAAHEIGTIYQACNFDYLGDKFGSSLAYILPDGRKVGARYFTRTNAMKRWAKELDIEWQDNWCKPNGFQDIKAIPSDIRNLLLDHARMKKEECETVRIQRKGKYILLLPKDRREVKKLKSLKIWNPLPYPKRKISG